MEQRESPTAQRGAWRTEVDVRIRELRSRLAAAEGLDPAGWQRGQTPEGRRAAAATVAACLDTATAASGEPLQGWDRLSAWWTGSAMTTAWESVHEAELKLLPLEAEDDVRAHLPRLRAWIQRAMDRGESRTRYEEKLQAQVSGEVSLDPLQIRQAFNDVIIANAERYANLRAFRNILVLVTGMLAGLVGVLTLLHVANPDFISLCTAGEADGEVVCFGGPGPRAWDVAMVAAFGAIGGLLAIAFGLAESEGPPSRYDPRIAQVGLKAAAGAATALAGVLFIQADLLVAPASSPSEALYLSYATIFGFSQQLFTRFVDRRAGELTSNDGKEVEAATERQT